MLTHLITKKRALFLFLCWWGMLFVLSTTPGPELDEVPFTINDKILHAGYFTLGSFFLGAAVIQWRPPNLFWNGPMAVFLALVVIGIIDETVQIYTPRRSGGDLYDLLADIFGAFVGTSVAWLIFRKK
jgi:VanZ family protein